MKPPIIPTNELSMRLLQAQQQKFVILSGKRDQLRGPWDEWVNESYPDLRVTKCSARGFLSQARFSLRLPDGQTLPEWAVSAIAEEAAKLVRKGYTIDASGFQVQRLLSCAISVRLAVVIAEILEQAGYYRKSEAA